MDRIAAAARAPVDLAGLAVFRMMFGVVMLVDFARYWIAGWIDLYYVTPAITFGYPWFEWVEPMPRVGMYVLFAVLMIASVAMALGFVYRGAAAVLAIGHGYVFLLAATHYLNHAYLLELLLVLMVFLPAADGLSIDAWRRPPRRRSYTPGWAPWLLRLQLGIVYIYGGIAKINWDWLAGEPIRGWLRGRATRADGMAAELLGSEWVVGLVVQGGLWFDLLIAPALLWRRTRILAVVVSSGFHLSNAWLFNIGVFPWFMLVATTLFFEPNWPRRLPWIGPHIDRWLGPVPEPEDVPSNTTGRWTLRWVGLWLAVQLVLPLRHHVYPGNVAWTEEGHYFAWRMKLRSKSGSARFVLRDRDTGDSWVVDPRAELSPRQVRKMIGKPELILQYAHHLADRWQRERDANVEVRAQVHVSLNHRPRRPFIDSTVDLTQIEPSMWPATWILPGPTEPVGRPR
ncbi:MAG: HTTM domain-containing protein [Myxococcota bacterium]